MRLIPKKRKQSRLITIPRLELLAALIELLIFLWKSWKWMSSNEFCGQIHSVLHDVKLSRGSMLYNPRERLLTRQV